MRPVSSRRLCAAGMFVITLALALFAGGMLGESASAGGDTTRAGDIKSLTWGVTLPVLSLDPALAYDGSAQNNVAAAECDSLLRFDSGMRLRPNLATSWKQTTPLKFVYQIRKGVAFWNGNEVTASDVAFSMNRILDPKVASPLQSLTTNVRRITATGPSEVTIELKARDPRVVYLAALPTGAVVEKATAVKFGKKFGTSPQTVMCAGPFQPTSFKKGSSVVLRRVPNYWNRARLPHVETLTFSTIPDTATLVAGLRNGEVDGTFYLNGRDSAALAANGDLVVQVKQGTQINYISPNLLKGPLKDLRIRQALSMAIDRKGLAFAISGKYGQPLKGPVAEGLPSFQQGLFQRAYNALPTPLTPQVAAAKRLIAAAGADGTSVSLAIMDGPSASIVGPALEQAGASIGLNVKVVKLTSSAFLAESFSGKFPRTYDGFVNFWASDFPDPAGTLVTFFGSKYSNVEGFFDKKYDALIARWARAPQGSVSQAKILIAMENYLMAHAVKIPLYTDPLIQIHKKSMGGYSQTKVFFYQNFAQEIAAR